MGLSLTQHCLDGSFHSRKGALRQEWGEDVGLWWSQAGKLNLTQCSWRAGIDLSCRRGHFLVSVSLAVCPGAVTHTEPGTRGIWGVLTAGMSQVQAGLG